MANIRRNEYFDEVRAVLAVFVILIHAATAGRGFLQYGVLDPNFVFTVVATQFYLCAVPIFVVLIGYFSPYVSKPATPSLLGRRLSRILIPYLIWSLVHIALNYQGVKQSVLQLATGRAADPYYFVFVAVCIYIFEYFVFRLKIKPTIIYAFTAAITVTHIVVAYVVHMRYPNLNWKWFMLPPTAWIVYYSIGLFFRLNTVRLSRVAVVFAVLCIAASSAESMVLASAFGLNAGPFDPVRFTILAYTISVFCSVLYFEKRAPVLRPIVWVGQVSYGIYLTHDLFLLKCMHLIDWIAPGLRAIQPVFQLGAGMLTLLVTVVLATISQLALGHERSRTLLGF